jgi:monoamine oxidase
VQAAAVVQQSNCVKVILRLKEVFWPADFWDVVCSDSLIPEIWLTPAAQVLKGIPMKEYYMVGFVAGERATRLAALPADELARKMCLQLDAIFGSPQNPAPCSKASPQKSAYSRSLLPL